MSTITRIVVLFIMMVCSAFAEKLEITVDQSQIKIPFWEAKEPRHGAVIIVKGGDYAGWSSVLARLAKKLSQYGWSTALLNCKSDSVPWIEQLPAAIGALRQKNNNRIILVHYGDQLNQSFEYFSKPQAKMINGMIMLSAYDDQKNVEVKRFRFPLFDVVGQFDYERVHQQKHWRERQFHKPDYHAVEMPGAQHDYEYSQRLLLAFLHGWMSKLPEIKPQPVPILSSYVEPISILVSHIASIDGFNTAGF